MNRWITMAVFMILLTVAAYLPSMRGPFLRDDLSEIAENPAIRTLVPPWRPMFEGGELAHRPLPYFSFADNYPLGRLLAAAGCDHGQPQPGLGDDARRAFEACLRIAPNHPQAAANLRALGPGPEKARMRP